MQDSIKADGTMKTSEDDLTCSICLEQVSRGELVRSLPCLHQVLPISILIVVVSQMCPNYNQQNLNQLVLYCALLLLIPNKIHDSVND